jgi:hypothetical protein
MTAVPLGPQVVQASLQRSQAGGVGGFYLLAQLFGFFLSPTQVLVYFGLMAVVISQGTMNIGQGKGIQTAGNLFRRHSHAPVPQQDIEGDARLADTDGTRFIDPQRHWIGV